MAHTISALLALALLVAIAVRHIKSGIHKRQPYIEDSHSAAEHDEKPQLAATNIKVGDALNDKRLVSARSDDVDDINKTPLIEPLPDFDWKTTEPIKFRPFKPTYHITMALQTSTPSDLITIDRTYLSRVTARREIIANHPTTVMGTTPEGHAAIREFYTYLLGTYLPTRYPTMFELVTTTTSPNGTPTTTFHNKATNHSTPLSPATPESDPLSMLHTLATTIEQDLFFLTLDPSTKTHRSTAFLCCHPSGFDPSQKGLGQSLGEIHGPVPSYDKIGPSMERFFSRLDVGRPVKRLNWGIQTHTELFAPSGNHVHVGEEVEEVTYVSDEDAGERVMLRVELQTLTRLPQTGALVFSFKTYLYPLAEIKSEGLGMELAEAIEGLKKGNAPGMWVYKGSVQWGKAVCEYLRRP